MASKWISTVCGMCYVRCGIRVLVEDGVVMNIEGDPNNPQNRGNMCAKGKAGIMNLYNPNRVKAPLKRTNPKKGVYEDPGWQEISWEEALGTIVAKLEEIRDDPKKLHIQAWEITSMVSGRRWRSAAPKVSRHSAHHLRIATAARTTLTMVNAVIQTVMSRICLVIRDMASVCSALSLRAISSRMNPKPSSVLLAVES